MNQSSVLSKEQTILLSLYKVFHESGDTRRAKQAGELYQKLKNNRFEICFCGHFSAGKSSLLNEFMQDDLLPTSPIPTSANLVSILTGDPEIEVIFQDGRSAQFTPPFDLDSIQTFCKNEDVSEVKVKTDGGWPKTLGMMDTPGIDSTDPAHQRATEDAIRRADVIYYVADYNHIQAANNYRFLKSVQKLGKPFHLIISQIDKHREEEITFEDYKANLVNGLSAWGLSPENIYYISLNNKFLPNNNFEQLKSDIQDYYQSQKQARTDISTLLHDLIDSHKQWWKEEHHDERTNIETQIEDNNALDNLDALEQNYESLKSKIEVLKEQEEQWIDRCIKETSRTIQSAILMPYETREKARAYLEARQPDFKMGLFSTKGKIDKERESRLQDFFTAMKSHIETLEKQTADTLAKAVESFIGKNEEVKQQIMMLSSNIGADTLSSNVNEGARVTGDYVLNYTETVSQDIQGQMKKLVRDKIEALRPSIISRVNQQKEALQVEFDLISETLNSLHALKEMNHIYNEHFSSIEQIIKGDELSDSEALEYYDTTTNKRVVPVSDILNTNTLIEDDEKPGIDIERSIVQEPENETKVVVDTNVDAEAWAMRFESVADHLKTINGFDEWARTLLKKAKRVRERQFTVALFGAFSAGKSSFANVLLGGDPLPVSPHPTTAAINRILPIDSEHPHGTVRVQLKSEETVIDEINKALQAHGQSINSLSELDSIFDRLHKGEDNDQDLFLRAAHSGWKSVGHPFGTVFETELNSGQKFIADEAKACFVEGVDIYFDCEATRNGLILVDTPGADSINSRHTEAAFQYIKNADAIIYVTYYNHAFSNADEEFLLQLGRVKESFELDKMFFIVNAVDLARSEAEKQEVMDYVQSRLLKFGIRQPRLFGVSSLLASGQQNQVTNEDAIEFDPDSGFDLFFTEWNHFLQNGLLGHLIDQGHSTLTRAKDVLLGLIRKATLDADSRKTAQSQLEDEYTQAQRILSEDYSKAYVTRIEKDIDEYFYYVKKRVIQRFIDEFNRFFNPAVFSKATASKKDVLRSCLDECIDFLSFDLDQEARATFLRIEATLTRSHQQMFSGLIRRYEELGEGWILNEPDEATWETTTIAARLKNCDYKGLESAFRYYKNPKQFFEGDGQQQFKAHLHEKLSDLIEAVLINNSGTAKQHYVVQWNEAIQTGIHTMDKQMNRLFVQGKNALVIDPEELAGFQTALERINETYAD